MLKRHFARYTPEMVERYCGISQDVFLKTTETFISASGPEKTGAICYAVGWTQHSKGVQLIRTAAILQLLLGILAARVEEFWRYVVMPRFRVRLIFPRCTTSCRVTSRCRRSKKTPAITDYIKRHRSRTGLWAGFDEFFISLMKAYYGDAATKENDWGFDWLPRVTGDHSHFGYWLDMADGKWTDCL